MPFDQLLFFADAGNGDQFATVLARPWPRQYLPRWLDGRIVIQDDPGAVSSHGACHLPQVLAPEHGAGLT